MIAIVSVFLSIIIFFIPLTLHLFNIDFYNKLYTENNVYEDLNRSDVEEITLDIFDFFKYNGSLNGNVRYADPSISSVGSFTDNEIDHMEDVRDLLKNIFILFLLSLFIFLVLFIIMIFTDKKKNLRDRKSVV